MMSAANGRGKSKTSRPRNKFPNSGPNVNKNQNPHNVQQEDYGILGRQQIAYILSRHVIGNEGEFYMTDSSVVNGLIEAVSPTGDFGLLYARTQDKASKKTSVDSSPQIIKFNLLKKVIIKNINPNQCLEDKFTDSEIAKSNSTAPRVERELKPYFDSAPEDDADIFESGTSFPPDQMFNVNAKEYNVQSSYKPEMEGYTIQLDKSAPDFKEKEKRCAKLAQAMEQEKAIKNDEYDENCDEELKYSAVRRAENTKISKNPIFKRATNVTGVVSKQATSSNGDNNIPSSNVNQGIENDEVSIKGTSKSHSSKGKIQASLSESNNGDKINTPINSSPPEEVSSSTVDSPKKEKVLDFDLNAPPFVPKDNNEPPQEAYAGFPVVLPPSSIQQSNLIPVQCFPVVSVPNMQKFVPGYDSTKMGVLSTHQPRSIPQSIQQPTSIVANMAVSTSKNAVPATSNVQKPTSQPQLRPQRSNEQIPPPFTNQYPQQYAMFNFHPQVAHNPAHVYNGLNMLDPNAVQFLSVQSMAANKNYAPIVDSQNQHQPMPVLSTVGHPLNVSTGNPSMNLQSIQQMPPAAYVQQSHPSTQQIPPQTQMPNHGPPYPPQTFGLSSSGPPSSQPIPYGIPNNQTQNIVPSQPGSGGQNLTNMPQPQGAQQAQQPNMMNQQLLQQHQAMGQVPQQQAILSQQNAVPMAYMPGIAPSAAHMNFLPPVNMSSHQPPSCNIYSHMQPQKSGHTYSLPIQNQAAGNGLNQHLLAASQSHAHSQSQQPSQAIPGAPVTAACSSAMPQATQSLSNPPSQAMSMSQIGS